MAKISAEDAKWQFFSVNSAVRIDGKKHIPCICYPITSAYRTAVLALAKDGKAALYESAVRFLSGKVKKQAEETTARTPHIVAAQPTVSVSEFSSDSE